jgi:hypothetical protein
MCFDNFIYGALDQSRVPLHPKRTHGKASYIDRCGLGSAGSGSGWPGAACSAGCIADAGRVVNSFRGICMGTEVGFSSKAAVSIGGSQTASAVGPAMMRFLIL